ncbi:MAG: glycogen synthase [Nitrospirae bacterium]|nr:MAG: glycogen synthase [Nitrospirota bacterium]
MKALFMTREYPPYVYGGAGIHVEYLSRELAKLIEVEVRCFGDQYLNEDNLKVKGYDYDKKRFENCDSKLKSPLSSLYNCVMFNVDPIDADVVHCHTWYAHFGGMLAKISYGTPLIITTHSLEPLRPWKREQLGRGYDLSSWIEKSALEMADAIIAVSKGMKQDVLELFNVDEDKVKVIHNGIDTDEYRPVKSKDSLYKYGIDPEKPYVLFFGRITRQKGIIHFINAINYIDEDAQIVLCAGEPDTKEIEKEMEESVKSIQEKRKNVIWIRQWIPTKEKIELYSNASVFCCPSIYEPFGIINLEAMACGVPVVASKIGGIPEIIEHGKTGYLVELEQYKESPFEPLDPEKFSKELAEPINKILRDESLRKKMGEEGRKRVEEYFSWKNIAKEVLNLYKELLEKR